MGVGTDVVVAREALADLDGGVGAIEAKLASMASMLAKLRGSLGK